jgi:hypothetical protein
MTPYINLVCEETYKDQSIKIYCFSQFAPGGVGFSHFYAIIDDYRLPRNFDGCSHNLFCASEDAGNPPTPKHSPALAAAKAYCDTRVKPSEQKSEQRRDELLPLTLFYRKVKTLLRQFFQRR